MYTVLVLGAKLGASAAFITAFMFTAQLYPTSIREEFRSELSTQKSYELLKYFYHQNEF